MSIKCTDFSSSSAQSASHLPSVSTITAVVAPKYLALFIFLVMSGPLFGDNYLWKMRYANL